MLSTNITLSPTLALILFVVGVLAGYKYRRVWKAEGPRAQLWVFGIIAAGCLLAVGLIPLDALQSPADLSR
ncbi:MAG: hypothetical protein AAF742_05350 [Pseudomonadota bacterium]